VQLNIFYVNGDLSGAPFCTHFVLNILTVALYSFVQFAIKLWKKRRLKNSQVPPWILALVISEKANKVSLLDVHLLMQKYFLEICL